MTSTASKSAPRRTEITIEDDSGSDYDSFDDGTYLGLLTDLDLMPNRTIKYLNLTDKYVLNWGCDAAFRECYQNWRDGILRSFRLNLSDFRTSYSENTERRQILIRAHSSNTTDLLGFIDFKYDKDGYCIGGLKMANFQATLQYRNLGTGGTTKAMDRGQTGQHGEGMKLAALVFRRHDYTFRIESGSFKWNFIFKRAELACQLTRMGKKTLGMLKSKAFGLPRTNIAHPWEDVCVIIATRGKARTIDGEMKQTEPLHVNEFKKWFSVTLDINPPKKMIRTIEGDLIRDPSYQSKMYLHGLLLPSGGIKGNNYAYGYNFIQGSTTRDRDSLVGSGKESKSIAAIWASAIRSCDSDDSDIVYEYTSLLISSLNKKGDAMLSSTRNPLQKDVAQKIWQQMREMHKDPEGRPPFYYVAKEGKDDVRTIEQSLNQNPFPLQEEMWNLLRMHQLCRTPAEELRHRFESAVPIQIPQDSFSKHVERMLRCLLLSFPAIETMEISFVDGAHLQIDAGFFTSKWRIHGKWLTHQGAHERERAFCDEEAPGPHDIFLCDHAVLELWDIMITQLVDTGDYPTISQAESHLKSLGRARVSQMPRHVICTTTLAKGELRVTWQSGDSYQYKDKQIRITLHSKSSCVMTDSSLSPGDLNLIFRGPYCKCPSQLSQAVSEGVTFRGLDPMTWYYPDVSRDEDGAFVAVQSAPIMPRSTNHTVRVDIEASVRPAVSSMEYASLNDTRDYASVHSQRVHDDQIDEDMPFQADRDSSPAGLPSCHGSEPDLDRVDDVVNSIHQSSTARNNYYSSPHRASAVLRPRNHEILLPQIHRQDAEDSYAPGTKIEHRSLDWGGSFPGSHDFFRTREKPEEDVFILKPRFQQSSGVSKRPHGFRDDARRSKQPRCETADCETS